jgi:hypothetical protein
MSVILDALKKLDREKSFRKNMTANIAVEILKPDLPRPGKRFPRYVATIFLTAMAAAVITYFTMVDFLPKSLPPSPVNPPAPSKGIVPAPMEFHFPLKSSVPAPVNPPASSQQVTPAPASREAVQEVRDEIDRKGPKPPTPPESKITVESKPAAASVDEKKAKPNLIREETETPSSNIKKIPEQATTGSPTNPPSLKLSAIVWYEDPSMRFAMVNGLKASEGTIVEGVKVVEIKPTSVRFMYNDKYFEISMQK